LHLCDECRLADATPTVQDEELTLCGLETVGQPVEFGLAVEEIYYARDNIIFWIISLRRAGL
jgi:hypothetical protein